MHITIPQLSDNLKYLKAVRKAIVIDAEAEVRQQLGLSIVLESTIAAHIDQVLGYLSINITPDSSGDPILVFKARVRDIPHEKVNMYFIGTSLVLIEDVLLARTFNWVPPVTSASPPKNAACETWSALDTATVVPNASVASQVVADVDRLLDAFGSAWAEANK